jgi:glycosyltransferase involved in cell wall biosynthesis
VGRYILGLLWGLSSIARDGAEGEAIVPVPLFAPAAALSVEGPAPRAAGGPGLRLLGPLRSFAKRLPGAYPLADLARAAALRRRHDLALFHETNHAPPRTGLPLVLTVHDLCTLLFAETQEPARARFFARALRTRARRAAQVIAPTAAVAGQLVALLGLERARVRHLHHGVDPALLRALEEPASRPGLLAAHGVDGPYLLFVGALEPRKGLPQLLDAWDQLPAPILRAHTLVLAGPAERIDAPLQRRLDRTREGRVVRLGYTPPAALPALYRHAAALCLPSVYEGFGLPLLEAMACGTPCATSDDPALVEVAGGAALQAPRGDAAALAARLCALLDDPALRARLAEAGRARAAGFTWEASARGHLAAYRDALAEARP